MQTRAELITTTTSDAQSYLLEDADLTKIARLKEQGILKQREIIGNPSRPAARIDT